jgi:aspartate carbamoyltransferase catalytic subunit
LRFVSPGILRLPLNIMNQVIDAGVDARETHDVADVIADADVLYVTPERAFRPAPIHDKRHPFTVPNGTCCHPLLLYNAGFYTNLL